MTPVDDPPSRPIDQVSGPDPGDEDRVALRSDILVVDDDSKNLTAIEVVLSELDVRLTMARSGKEALRHLLGQEYAVILLDVQMPEMDGFETARLIRTRDRMRHVPIIFVTAFSQNEADIRRGYELGAVDYLFKPIVPEVLRAKVQVFVDLKDRSAEIARQAQQLRQAERLANIRRLEEERRKWEAESLKQQMEEQRRINAHLAETDRKKDEFIAMLAHELRNPLAPIVTSLELVRLQVIDDPIVTKARDAMERQVHHLTRLIDDLLDVSRISQGKLELHREHIDLHEVVDHAVETCQPALDRMQHRLTVEGPDGPVPLFADPVRLTQVVSNLLNNAARYSDPGGEIALRWSTGSSAATISVTDKGRGIAPEFIHRIFDMFSQERDGGKGLGLGLTLVRQLVDMHGGRVEARSDGRGKGSEFVISLPLSKSKKVRARRTTNETAKVTRVPVRLRIAVVEDDVDIRQGLQTLLERWGHDVAVAETGPTGADLVIATRPDVALLDIGLPGLDGYAVAKRICEQLGNKRPRLVAMTGFGQQSDRQRAHEAGFDVHLVKPSSPEELQEALHEPPAEAHGSERPPPLGPGSG